MSAKRNFNVKDFLSVLRKGSILSTGNIAKTLHCHRTTALRYLRELKAKKQIVETRISNTLNVWRLTRCGNILIGDCAETLKQVESESVDLIVTDPPYGYSFMGLSWDSALPSLDALKECCRVLKAGAFAFFMCSSRTDLLWRMGERLEKAGFETGFSSIYWTYATGFPKASETGKLIDKRAGAEREVIGENPYYQGDNYLGRYENPIKKAQYITAPSTEQAKKFNGSYSPRSLKPAVEVIIVVLKPLSEKTYVDQALTNSHGVLWLDDCRIPWASDNDMWQARDGVVMNTEGRTCYGSYNTYDKAPDNGGRFPANLLVCDDALKDSDSGSFSRYFDLDLWFKARLPEAAQKTYPYLIVPKPSKREKNRHGVNNHPTVKPLKLMSYLITMGSREGDVVLDPFAGSGTTLEAANLLKRQFIGCESDEKYRDIIEARAHVRGYSR